MPKPSSLKASFADALLSSLTQDQIRDQEKTREATEKYEATERYRDENARFGKQVFGALTKYIEAVSDDKRQAFCKLTHHDEDIFLMSYDYKSSPGSWQSVPSFRVTINAERDQFTIATTTTQRGAEGKTEQVLPKFKSKQEAADQADAMRTALAVWIAKVDPTVAYDLKDALYGVKKKKTPAAKI